MTIRIAQISDLHVSPGKPYFNANMACLFAELERARPDIVLNTGDLGLFGELDNGDIALALEAHRALGIDTRIVPGNHDVGEHPDIGRGVLVNEDSLARYRAKVGPDFWVLDLPGWRLVGVNALIAGTSLSGSSDQLARLAEASRTRENRSFALVLHKPLADLDYADRSVSPRFLTHGPRHALLSAIGEAPANLVLCGHVHQFRDRIMGGSRHIWAPPASFVIGDPWQPSYGGKTMGYLDHRFHADGTHDMHLVTVRGLAHNDLATMPEVYGDVTARGPGNG